MPTMTAAQKRVHAKAEFDAYLAACPSRLLLDRISDKWVTLVICSLEDGPLRFSEVSRRLAGVSQKMLTQTLRTLERDGLVTRTVTASVPVRVDYALTAARTVPAGADQAREGVGRAARPRGPRGAARLRRGPGGLMTQVLTPREVPLGGLRAMTVRRTLPQRDRTFVGAWCFADHYGPDEVDDSGGMVVPPHPHTGLQTVSWLFAGEIEHRDSAGHQALVRPGELNLMTGGRGVSHSEVSTSGTTTLHGVQLWVALPDAARDDPADFEHYVPAPLAAPGWEARVFLGSALGDTSPVRTATPLLGIELLLEPGTVLDLEVDETFEHGVLLDSGSLVVGDQQVKPAELAYVEPGRTSLRLEALEASRLVVLGGPPFGEEIVMWWNFVGRTHEEVVQAREEWQAQITRDGAVATDGQDVADGRFGVVVGEHLPPVPAPALPTARLKPRR